MQEKPTRVQAATISNFQRRIVQNEKKRQTIIERDGGLTPTAASPLAENRMIPEQPTSTFLHLDFVMRKLKYSMQDRQKPFFEFQQTAAVEICVKFRYKLFLKSCLYST